MSGGFSTVAEVTIESHATYPRTHSGQHISQVLFPLFPLSGPVQTHLSLASLLCSLYHSNNYKFYDPTLCNSRPPFFIGAVNTEEENLGFNVKIALLFFNVIN